MNLLPETAAKLTDMQAAFVEALVTNGGNRTQAAIEAGYSPDTARQQAHAIVRIPHVMQAILEATMSEFISNAPKASTALTQLLEGRSEYVRLEAAKEILDRAGLKPATNVNHKVAGDISVSIDLT
jgi:phage terminase small subunit